MAGRPLPPLVATHILSNAPTPPSKVRRFVERRKEQQGHTLANQPTTGSIIILLVSRRHYETCVVRAR